MHFPYLIEVIVWQPKGYLFMTMLFLWEIVWSILIVFDFQKNFAFADMNNLKQMAKSAPYNTKKSAQWCRVTPFLQIWLKYDQNESVSNLFWQPTPSFSINLNYLPIKKCIKLAETKPCFPLLLKQQEKIFFQLK